MRSSSQTTPYAQSIASDIFAMISASREQGLDLDTGFQNQAFSNPGMAIRYLFFPRKELLGMGMFPKSMRQRFKAANILSIVEQKGKVTSVNLLCTLNRSFSTIQSAGEIEKHLHPGELNRFADAVRNALSRDLQDEAGAMQESVTQESDPL